MMEPRTESLMGSGKLFSEVKVSQNGVEVKYQLQVTSSETGASQWQGFIRMPVGQVLPGTNNANPNPKMRFILILDDNGSRRGLIQIERLVAQVGGFYNYAVIGQGD